MRYDVVLDTLLDTDPEFGLLCAVLYGDTDRDLIYDDLMGVEKFDSSKRSFKEEALRKIGLGATIAGVGLGVGEIAHGAEAGHFGQSAAKAVAGKKAQVALKPLKAITAGKRGAYLATGMIAGDLAAVHGLKNKDVEKGLTNVLSSGVRRTSMIAKPTSMTAGKGFATALKPLKPMAPPKLGVMKGVNDVLLRGLWTGAKTTGRGIKGMTRGSVDGLRPLQKERPLRPHPLAEKGKGFGERKPNVGHPDPMKAPADPAANRWQEFGASVKNPVGIIRRRPVTSAVVIGGGAAALEHRRMNKPLKASQPEPMLTPYDPNSFVAKGEFSKFDDDQRLAFGWASITEKDGMPVVDRQGDYIDSDVLEKAAYSYVMKSRVGGDMHRRNGENPHAVSDMVESFVITKEKIAKMGLPEDTPCGWWVGFKVHDDDTWQEVKKSGRTGFSIHGKARRVDTDYDSLMGAS